jgi:hypothetical protein
MSLLNLLGDGSLLLTVPAMTPLLKDIVDALKPFTHLYQNLPFLDAERFIRFAAHVKRKIQLTQPLRQPDLLNVNPKCEPDGFFFFFFLVELMTSHN